MQCHKPGHRAPARCASALLAAGALLATAVDQAGRSSTGPALQAAALGIPVASGPTPPAPAVAGPGSGPQSPSKPAATPAPTPQSPAAQGPAAQGPAAQSASKPETKPPAEHAAPSESQPSESQPEAKPTLYSRGRPSPAPSKHTVAYLMAHLPPAKNPKAAKAVREALSLQGVPYRWGGTTKSGGFDCSGFTQHVWAVAGVKIPRTVREQAAKAGTHISLSKAEPGDLVVFYATQHHIGIYVGNGLVIDSPHPGASVRPDRVSSMPVSVVVRVHT